MPNLDELKGKKPGCNTTGHISNRDGLFVMPVAHVCFCNKAADDKNPGLCDAVCANEAYYPRNCECKNPSKAGLFCHEDACKLAGRVYCAKYLYSRTARKNCEDNANRGRMEDIRYCPCGNGRLVNDRCYCDQYYSGPFCDEYTPPFIAQPTSTPRSQNNGFNIGLPISIIFIVILFTVTFVRLWRRHCRGACDCCYSVRAPDPPIPESSMPMNQPPYASLQPYPPGPQPYPPAAANPERASTTYTFQTPAPGGNSGYQQPIALLNTDRHEDEREPLDQTYRPPPKND